MGSRAPDLKHAWRLHKEGRSEEALAAFEALVALRPDDIDVRLWFARLQASFDTSSAFQHLNHAVSVAPDNTEVLEHLAGLLFSQRRWDEAEAIYKRLLEKDPNSAPWLVALGRLYTKRGRFAVAQSLYLRAIQANPGDPRPYQRLSDLLSFQAVKMAEAAAGLTGSTAGHERTLASAYQAAGQHEKGADILVKAAARRPGDQFLRGQLEVARALQTAPAQRRRPAIWPRTIGEADYENVVRKYVISGAAPPEPVLTPRSKVVTLGSCFAEHLAETLRERGIDVLFQKRSENFDNLLAAEHLIDLLIGRKGDGAEVEGWLPPDQRLAFFRDADAIILSLGVSAAYFHRETGAFYAPSLADFDKSSLAAVSDFRMLTLEENLGALGRIIDTLRELNPRAAIVLTVSPVPLAATFERASAVQADAVSKATLRLTVERLIGEGREGVFYWPSFEMVKWLGAHLPKGASPVFGGDDGATRHVSRWVVRMVIRLFLETFGRGFEAETARDVASAGEAQPLAAGAPDEF